MRKSKPVKLEKNSHKVLSPSYSSQNNSPISNRLSRSLSSIDFQNEHDDCEEDFDNKKSDLRSPCSPIQIYDEFSPSLFITNSPTAHMAKSPSIKTRTPLFMFNLNTSPDTSRVMV